VLDRDAVRQILEEHADSIAFAPTVKSAEKAIAAATYYRPDAAQFAVDEATQTEFVQNHVIVFFEHGTSAETKRRAVEAVGGTVVAQVDAIDKMDLLVPGGESLGGLQKICAALERQPGVKAAVENRVFTLIPQASSNDPWSSGTDSNAALNRWAMEAIEAPGAWEYNDFLGKVRIGLVDSGADNTHEELSGIVQNINTINVPDFEKAQGGVLPYQSYTYATTPEMHGTAVASLMAARANNGKGLAGLAWDAEVYSVDWQPGSMSDNRSAVGICYDALVQTVMKGANAVNYSLGTITIDEDGVVSTLSAGNIAYFGWLSSLYIASLIPNYPRFVVVQSAGNYRTDAINNGLFACVNLNNTGQNAAMAQMVNDRILITGGMYNDGTRLRQWVQGNAGTAIGSQVTIYAPSYRMFRAVMSNGYANTSDGYGQGTSYAAPLVCATAAMMLAADEDLSGGQAGALLKGEAVSPRTVRDYDYLTNFSLYPMLNTRLALEAVVAEPALEATPGAALVVDQALRLVKLTSADTPAAALPDQLQGINAAVDYPKAAVTDAFAATGDKVRAKLNDVRWTEYRVIVAGDLNGDGRVNGMDALRIQLYLNGNSTVAPQQLLGEPAFLVAADANCDGAVNQADFELARRRGLLLK
jgi:hypothetical protein